MRTDHKGPTYNWCIAVTLAFVAALTSTPVRAECEVSGDIVDERAILDDPSTAASAGACGVRVLARVVTKSSSLKQRSNALAQLGYVARFHAHFDATSRLRYFAETSREPEIRAAALSALRSASLGLTSTQTDMKRHATHEKVTVRASLIDVITRECNPNDRAVVDAGLAQEKDVALQAKWRAASQAVETCTQPTRAAVLAVMRKERTLRSLACDEATLIVNDQFIVENASVDRRDPRVSARRTGAAAVAASVELDALLSQVHENALHCSANECVHHGRINSSEFAFWFAKNGSAVCLERVVRTRHEMEPTID